MIYTTYFANLKKLPDNIIPISIAAKAPNGYVGLEYKKLAPTYDLFMEYKKNFDTGYYTTYYNNKILSRLTTQQVYFELMYLCGNTKSDIALICYEKPDKFCHRHLVRKWLNDNGVICKELGV